MSTAAQLALSEGLDVLDAELGETFVSAVGSFVGLLERNDARQLSDYAGVIRETTIHAKRAQAVFAAGLPEVGSTIERPEGGSTRLASIRPSETPGYVVFVLADEFTGT